MTPLTTSSDPALILRRLKRALKKEIAMPRDERSPRAQGQREALWFVLSVLDNLEPARRRRMPR